MKYTQTDTNVSNNDNDIKTDEQTKINLIRFISTTY